MIDYISLEGKTFLKATTYQELLSNVLITPQGFNRVDLGVCSDGANNVIAYTYGNLENQPTIFIDGTIHGHHEWRCVHWLQQFAELLANPTNHPYSSFILQLKSKFSFFIIPCLNPYGYENDSYTNANGINLNRNFDYNFSSAGDGSYAFSEPETQIIRDNVLTYKPILYINNHTWGGYTDFMMGVPEKPYGQLMIDISKTVEKNTGYTKNYTLTDNDASANNWVSTITSKEGILPISAYFEPGSENIELEQSFVAVNAMFIFCMYVVEYFEKRNLLLDKLQQ